MAASAACSRSAVRGCSSISTVTPTGGRTSGSARHCGDLGDRGEGQQGHGPVGVVTQGVAVPAEQSGRQGEGDGVAAAQDGGQDAVAVVEEAEPGVVSAPVEALPLLPLRLGQDPATGFEFLREPVERLAGHAGQGGVREQVGGLGRDRRCLRPVRLGRRCHLGIVGGDGVVPLPVEVVPLDALGDHLALVLGERTARGVVVLVEGGVDGKSGAGAAGLDALEQYFVAGQGPSAQAVGDAGEQAVLAFVPLRCSGWKCRTVMVSSHSSAKAARSFLNRWESAEFAPPESAVISSRDASG